MQIKQITENKKQYMDLLLIADEQESMIDRYLDRGDMFALFDDDLKAVCVVTDEGEGVLEIKNIATKPKEQRKGYGRELIEHLCSHYKDTGGTIVVGTGDSPLTMPFYRKCGFEECYRLKDFFIDNYDLPIYECGEQLVDMVYLKRKP